MSKTIKSEATVKTVITNTTILPPYIVTRPVMIAIIIFSTVAAIAGFLMGILL